MLVSLDQLNESIRRFKPDETLSAEKLAGLKKYESITETAGPAETEKDKGNILSSAENLENRKKMLETVGKEPVNFAYERAIGKNDSVYSNFCELIEQAKVKVGRIVVKSGNKATAYATGFMVSERLVMTNWHVFNEKADVEDSEINFNYELDVFGRSMQPVTFKLDADAFFFSDKKLDYCFVAVNPVDVTGKVKLSSIGYLYLNPATGKLGDEKTEALNIIHHPDGDYKQLSIRENIFVKIMPETLWYSSDTSQGSSGSPVFNDQWQVVALHHMGVPAMTPDGKQFLDKNGNVIEPENGKIDISKIQWIANEGIRISVILKDIFNKFPGNSLINSLKTAPKQITDPIIKSGNISKSETSDETNNSNNNYMDKNNSDNVQISFPASLIEASGNITINISNKYGVNQVVQDGRLLDRGQSITDDMLDEVKKIEKENSIDYSDCKGYESKFLGSDIPIPVPKKSINKFIAKLKGKNTNILKYYHYSVIFHSVRMMPVLSAINVDGDPDKRKDDSERKDDWLRDNRLDIDIQLNDKYYKGSGFDKGHMSRREDANWGDTAKLAKLYADMTCMYTNACPQVAALNQSKRKGLWGKLEIAVLEKGAEKEAGKTGKISVFNGPVFKDTDPVYKGIQIPMEFWKIIIWFNNKKEMKATAFKLSQSKLVGDIDFEALDIDANLEFKEYQCSIKSLEKDTNIDFSDIIKFDTFKKIDVNEMKEINSEDELEELIVSHS